jgi:nicotinate-nucleotide pyrophosphorylase (carboxylating)
MSAAPEDPFASPAVTRLIDAAVQEDVGRGDITSDAIVPPGRAATATITAKGRLVIAGLPLIGRIYERFGRVAVTAQAEEGDWIPPGVVVARVDGDARALLGGERTVLNVLQHLSGIATLTRRCVEALAGSPCTIRDTRKTLPGLRLLEKYAVRVGGGTNHRMRLDDGVLIKDNHVALAGGVAAAVAAARRALAAQEIEVECSSVAEVGEALEAGAEVILLDNMPAARMAEAVWLARGRARTEASGGITPDRLAEMAALGVDFVSMGCLTHSAPAVDLSMSIVPRDADTTAPDGTDGTHRSGVMG